MLLQNGGPNKPDVTLKKSALKYTGSTVLHGMDPIIYKMPGTHKNKAIESKESAFKTRFGEFSEPS